MINLKDITKKIPINTKSGEILREMVAKEVMQGETIVKSAKAILAPFSLRDFLNMTEKQRQILINSKKD